MLDKQNLLDSRQMAEFVARGFLRFDQLVPDAINERVMREIDNDVIEGAAAGTPISQCYHGTGIREMLRSATGARADPQSGRRRSAL